MTSTFLIRVGLLLIPVAMIPFVQLLGSAAPGTAYPELLTNISEIIRALIPLLFAVFASLTEPNNSKSWQIISTIIVFFILRSLYLQYSYQVLNIDLLSAFTSSVITAAFSSRITANTLIVRRYILSRLQNLGILVFWCLVALIAVTTIQLILQNIFNPQDENNWLVKLPITLQTFIFGFFFQLLKPFGLDFEIISFIELNPQLALFDNTSERLFLYSYTNILFMIPTMLVALCIKISSDKKLPIVFLAFISLFTSFFPGAEGFICLTIMWIWPGLYIVHMELSGIYLTVLLNLDSLEINPEFINSLNKQSFFNDNFLHIGNHYAAYIVAITTSIYFVLTLTLLHKYPASSLTWKIKKHKSVRIRLIRDNRSSKDLSLYAIRLIKMTGGLDNITSISTNESQIKIGFEDLKQINRDALKGFGSESYINTDEKAIFINSTEPKKTELIKKKIIIFAAREFSFLSEVKENK